MLKKREKNVLVLLAWCYLMVYEQQSAAISQSPHVINALSLLMCANSLDNKDNSNSDSYKPLTLHLTLIKMVLNDMHVNYT